MKTYDWKSVAAALPAAAAALLPQLFCPACWPAYTALLSSLGVGFINYSPWLLPVTIIFLALAVAMLFFQAKKRKKFEPFYLGLAAAFAVLLGKFLLSMNAVVYAGVACLISASVWNAWPRTPGEVSETCSHCE
ncbi:MAG: MerC domain-containing protein [Gammaproteobacteria bacterium]